MLMHTIRQQLKGMAFFALLSALALFSIAKIADNINNFYGILPLTIQVLAFAWPLISAALLFGTEFKAGALPYLLSAPNSRRKLVWQKILPAIVVGWIPLLMVLTLAYLSPSSAVQITPLGYFLFYLSWQFLTILFSYTPSLLTLFALSGLAIGGVVYSFKIIVGSTIFLKFGQSYPYYFRIFELLLSEWVWLFPMLTIILLITWLFTFARHAQPDPRRTARRMLPTMAIGTASALILSFTLTLLFMPDYYGSRDLLTREGYLLSIKVGATTLHSETGSHTIHHLLFAELLAETDNELIIASEGEGQVLLQAMHKKSGNTRQFCKKPGRTTNCFIFQPPGFLIYLNDQEGYWLEIDIASGQEKKHSFLLSDAKKPHLILRPVLQLKNGEKTILLAVKWDYLWRQSRDWAPLYQLRPNQLPVLLGEYRASPLPLAEDQFLLTSRKALFLYKYSDDQLVLEHEWDLPGELYSQLMTGSRFWPVDKSLFFRTMKIGKHSESDSLFRLNLKTLELTPLEFKGAKNEFLWIVNTPNWSYLLREHPRGNEIQLTRLDAEGPQTPLIIKRKNEWTDIHFFPYGLLRTEQWKPVGRIALPSGKVIPLPDG